MSGVEILCGIGLVLPAASPALAIAAPISAAIIAGEMLVFCGVHLKSEVDNHSHMIYWLVVASIGALLAFGRFLLVP
jgi:hypothetical protein